MPNGSYIYPNNPIPCDGVITRWDYHSNAFNETREHSGYIAVWRKIREFERDVYLLVNHTKITPYRIGLNHRFLDPGELIYVQKGDVLGYYQMYEEDEPLIGVNTADNPGSVRSSDRWDVIQAPHLLGFQMTSGPGKFVADPREREMTKYPKFAYPALYAHFSTPACVGPQPFVKNGVTLRKEARVNETVAYQCQRGFTPNTAISIAPYTIQCLKHGQWSVAPALYCVQDVQCRSNYVDVGGSQRVPVGGYLFPLARFSCDGYLWSWNFTVVNGKKPVFLAVWRTSSTNRAKLVGVNKFTPNINQEGSPQQVIVPKDKQIFVKSGDFIGFHFEKESYNSGDSPIAVFPGGSDISPTFQFDHATLMNKSQGVVPYNPSNSMRPNLVASVSSKLYLVKYILFYISLSNKQPLTVQQLKVPRE